MRLLGKLIQSRALSKHNDELLVIVTPEIVKPVPAGQLPGLEMPQRLPGEERVPNTSGTAPAAPPTERMPVERLIQQLKTENQTTLQKKLTVGTFLTANRRSCQAYNRQRRRTGAGTSKSEVKGAHLCSVFRNCYPESSALQPLRRCSIRR